MANYTYDPGPQLPNYMKKRVEAGAPSGAARAAKETAPRKKTSSSAARSGGGTARKVSSGAQAGRTAKPQTQKRGTNSSKTTHSAAKTTHPTAASAKKRGGTTGENKRKKAQQRKRMLHVLLAAAVGLAGIICIIWLASREDTDNIPTDIEAIMSTKKTFRDGVKLIGVDVSGMTPEEATGLVKYAAEKKLEKVAVTVALEDAGWTFSASDLGMSYDLTEMFADGLAYGRSDDSEVQDVLAAGAGEFDAEYTWSRETILLALAQLEPSINTEATQPYAEPITDWESKERFNYIAGAEGRALNAEATADKIEYALRTGEFVTTVEPVVNAVLPTNTIDEVKAHTQYISEYTTTFSAARDDETKQNRLFNIRKAADIINGNTIRPGEQWSFNTVVGPRTFELGWKAANGISGGKEYTLQAGGGICQPSTTLYNALLCAGANMDEGADIAIVDRRAHTIPSDYVDVGLDATVDTRGIDFVFQNNTEYPLFIFAEVKNVEGRSSRYQITVYVYGEPLPEGVTYKSRSEITEVISREAETVYTNVTSIPTGYQKERIEQRAGYIAEAYLDKYVNGERVEEESKLLYTDRYKGNPAEIDIGTGPALQAGEAVPEGLVPVGTPPTPASSRA